MGDENAARRAGHYVYLYRDERGNALYVGYGRDHRRATSHLTESHNAALARAIRRPGVTLEISGPFDSERTARAVETALMSAINPRVNIAGGESRWRFRVLGVPAEYSNRLVMPGVVRKDFTARSVRRMRCPVVFVNITEKELGDGRPGYDPARPPSDHLILERVREAWQIGRFATEWERDPSASARLLVAVTGSPSARTIIASVSIDSSKWGSVTRYPGGTVSVPTAGPANLDAFELRGRRLASEAGIKFGSFAHQQFVILFGDGSTVGGHRSVRDSGWV